MDIFYFGYSTKMLKILLKSDLYNVIGVVTQSRKYGTEFHDICVNNKLNLFEIDTKEKLLNVCSNWNCDKIIMYEFGIIIPKELCKEFNIVNFHMGNLENNRGANPISWSILHPELGAQICAYRINDQIDSGELISYKNVTIEYMDTPITLKQKMENYISEILEAVYKYFINAKKSKEIRNGIYRKRICESDYTIDLENDSKDIIRRKINSQIPYKGAIIYRDNKKIYVTSYEFKQEKRILKLSEGETIEII